MYTPAPTPAGYTRITDAATRLAILDSLGIGEYLSTYPILYVIFAGGGWLYSVVANEMFVSGEGDPVVELVESHENYAASLFIQDGRINVAELASNRTDYAS